MQIVRLCAKSFFSSRIEGYLASLRETRAAAGLGSEFDPDSIFGCPPQDFRRGCHVLQRDTQIERQNPLRVVPPASLAMRDHFGIVRIDPCDPEKLAFLLPSILNLPVVVSKDNVHGGDALVGDVGVVVDGDDQRAGLDPLGDDGCIALDPDRAAGNYNIGASDGGLGIIGSTTWTPLNRPSISST